MNEEMNRIDLWMKNILECLEGCLEIVVWMKGAWPQNFEWIWYLLEMFSLRKMSLLKYNDNWLENM